MVIGAYPKVGKYDLCRGSKAEHAKAHAERKAKLQSKINELDAKIQEMIGVRRPVLFDCRVDQNENCYPMIPAGNAARDMVG